MTRPEIPLRPRRRLARRAGAVLLALLVLLAAAGWRLSRGEVAVPGWAVDRLVARLDAGLPAGTLAVSDVALLLDLEDGAMRLRLANASLTRDDASILSLPAAEVSFDGPALLRGRLRPRSVVASDLSLALGRDAEGRFTFATGTGTGRLPTDPAEWLGLLDAVLSDPAVARLDAIRVENLTLDVSDEITGLAERIEGGRLDVSRDPDGVRGALTLSLPTRRGDAALSLDLTRDADGAHVALALDDLPLSRLAELLPQVPALTLARGDLSLGADVAVDAAGAAGPLRGRIALSDASLVDRPRLALDRAAFGFTWQVGADRIGVTELRASSDELSVAATGQVILERGVTGPVQAQLRLSGVELDPEGMFDRRVSFDDGVIEARLTQSPLALRIGQAVLTGPSGTARLSGAMTFGAAGPDGTLRLSIPEMAVGDVAALWPRDLQVQARRWFTRNLIDGTAKGAEGVLRVAPGRPPEAVASLAFADATFRYMRTMPPAEEASGAVQLDGARLSVRLDRATVPAIGPDGAADGADKAAGRLRIDGSEVVLPDLSARPPRAKVTLRARGRIEDTLTLLDNPPFRLLDRLNQTREMATGEAEAVVAISLPLRRRNAPADIDYAVDATLINAESVAIVPGRRIAGTGLSLTVVPEAVEIAGDVTFEGIPFSGRWRHPLPPRPTEPIDPEAPPAAGPPPPPGRVEGTASVTPEALAALGVSVGGLELSGRTDARIEIDLPPGGVPLLRATSDLRGMAAALPVIDWRLGRGTAGPFSITAELGSSPQVRALSIDAPGLRAEGSVALNGGTLREARFNGVRTPWFRGAITLEGRGPNAAPGVVVRGGRADLSAAPFGKGGSGGDTAPIRVALESLRITDGIALTDLSARLRGGAGSFTARVNGGTAVEGVLVPQGGGTVVQVRGPDAGGVLRSAGLFEDARGGGLTLTLRSGAARGTYDGSLAITDVRVRDAPALASLLQTLSVVGILEQLTGEGLYFQTVDANFSIRPDDVVLRRASAVGPSMSITADGLYDLSARRLDLQGVISPIYLVNGLFGALFSRRDEGLFGFTYRMRGSVDDPQVAVNPLSILTPGAFREIFRRPPPS